MLKSIILKSKLKTFCSTNTFKIIAYSLIMMNYCSASNLEYNNYITIITPNANKFIQKLWLKAQPEFNKLTSTEFVQKIEHNTLTQQEFNQFLKIDIVYLRELGKLLVSKSFQSSNEEIRINLKHRGQMFIDSYNKYKNNFKNLDQTNLLSNRIKFHLNYLNNLFPEQLLIATLPCMMLYRGIGVYLNDKVPQEGQWRPFIERRIRTELLELLEKYMSKANELITEKNYDEVAEIFEEAVKFEIDFLANYPDINFVSSPSR